MGWLEPNIFSRIRNTRALIECAACCLPCFINSCRRPSSVSATWHQSPVLHPIKQNQIQAQQRKSTSWKGRCTHGHTPPHSQYHGLSWRSQQHAWTSIPILGSFSHAWESLRGERKGLLHQDSRFPRSAWLRPDQTETFGFLQPPKTFPAHNFAEKHAMVQHTWNASHHGHYVVTNSSPVHMMIDRREKALPIDVGAFFHV